ncbi:MAG: hypothetical protein WAK40_05815 [Thermoplasmata archaeon]
MIPPHLSEVRKRFVVALQLEPGDRGDSTAQRSLAAGEPDSRCRMPLDTVSTTGSKMPPAAIFGRPTAVILCGQSRPLLNWLISALASKTDPEFIWTDVRLRGEVLAEADPLGRGFVSSDRSNVVFPQELAPNDPAGRPSPEVSADRPVPPPTVRRLGDFLRLPLHTRGRLAGAPTGGQPIVLALSNARRMVALYPAETVAPVVRPIVEEGAILFVTFADAPPEGRFAFETILRVEGESPRRWKEATRWVEKAPPDGPLPTDARCPLPDFEPVAAILASAFP